MKTSPLCTRDNGREVFFTAKRDAQKFRITLSAKALDHLCGDTADEAQRKTWVKENKMEILAPLTADIADPMTHVLIEEIE